MDWARFELRTFTYSFKNFVYSPIFEFQLLVPFANTLQTCSSFSFPTILSAIYQNTLIIRLWKTTTAVPKSSEIEAVSRFVGLHTKMTSCMYEPAYVTYFNTGQLFWKSLVPKVSNSMFFLIFISKSTVSFSQAYLNDFDVIHGCSQNTSYRFQKVAIFFTCHLWLIDASTLVN